MTQVELAAYVQTHLASEGIQVVLSGGSAVSYYVGDLYVSKDIDLIAEFAPKKAALKHAMAAIGFENEARYYTHPQSNHIIEILPGPISVGDQPVTETREIELATGTLRILTPTDAVKDRLAAYFYWNDAQALQQALWIGNLNRIDLTEIERWAQREKKTDKFTEFRQSLKSTPPP